VTNRITDIKILYVIVGLLYM